MKLTMKLLKKCIQGTYEIDENGFVNVEGNVDLFSENLTSFGNIKFGKISGNFYCYYNNLTSLEGSPKYVGGEFYCYSNNLTSLEGSPKEVSGYFDCSYNKLTSLEGSPKYVGGNFLCYDNKLTSLEGSPKVVGGNFSCHTNNLTNFDLHCKVEGKIQSDQELNVKHPYSKEILRELLK